MCCGSGKKITFGYCCTSSKYFLQVLTMDTDWIGLLELLTLIQLLLLTAVILNYK